jgi:hypothetical protein
LIRTSVRSSWLLVDTLFPPERDRVRLSMASLASPPVVPDAGHVPPLRSFHSWRIGPSLALTREVHCGRRRS